MQHLDEGTIHAWIDGELPPDEASRVEAHARSCAECGALVAEARGLVAASSRIVSALDVTPSGVLPAFGARKGPRRWMTAKLTTAIAATLVIAAGTMMTVRGRDETPAAVTKHDAVLVTKFDTVASAPSPKPTSNPRSTLRPMAAAKGGDQTNSIVAAAAAPAPTVPAIAADTIGKVTALAQVDTASLARSAVPTARMPRLMTGAGAAGGVAAVTAPAQRKGMAVMGAAAQVMDAARPPSYVACYELNESTDVLPRRFALRVDSVDSGVGGSNPVRYIDSAGVVDGRMVDAGWMEIGGRAVIRTARLGQILTILRTGNDILAQSPLGPRTVRVTTCH